MFFRLKHKISNDKQKKYDKKIVFDFICLTIRKLEEKIAAESIEKIVSAEKTPDNFRFQIVLENSLVSPKINSQIIEKLDKFRENSLFKIYNHAQKTQNSVISQNVWFYNFYLNNFLFLVLLL